MKITNSLIVRLAFVVCFGAIAGCNRHHIPKFPTVMPPTLKVPTQQISSAASPTAVDCGLFREPAGSSERISIVGLSERIDPVHAPHPTNESERLLFRQLYETLVRADCEGHAAPGLAASWRFDESAKKWIVTLRQNARFTNDSPVTSMAVVSSWMVNGSELRPDVRRLVRSIVVVDDRTLEIDLQSSRPDALLALAHTDLAISTPVPGVAWPLGTQSATIDSRNASEITLRRPPENAATRFLIASGRDGRDLLDRGVDLLLTRDPRTLDYAATLPQFQTAPLP